MISAQITRNTQVAGLSFPESRAVSANFAILHDALIAGGAAATLTVRTDNTSGSITASTGHGITTAQVVDLYWVGGQRRGVIVGTVATNVIPFSGGLGDVLPAAAFAVVVSPRTQLPASVIGNNIAYFSMYATNRGTLTFTGSDSVEDVAYVIDDGGVIDWRANAGVANPLAAQTNAYVYASHGQTSAKSMKVAILFN